MTNIQKNIRFYSIAMLLMFVALYFMFGGGIGGVFIAGMVTFIGVVVGLLAIALQHQRNKAAFADKQKSGDDMAVHQTRQIEIDLPFNAAFELALEILDSLDGEKIPKTVTGLPVGQVLKIHKSDPEIGRIEAGLRAKTMGIPDPMDFTRIDIQLQRIDNQTTMLQIESKPANPLEVYDMGRHTHYVNQLAIGIRKASRDASAAKNLSEHEDIDETTDEQDGQRKASQS